MAQKGQAPTFEGDLQIRLVREALAELQGGRMESFGFERPIQTVLIALGAQEALIVPRNPDKGADIIATFRVAGAFQQVIAVQAKHWRPELPVGREVVQQDSRHGSRVCDIRNGDHFWFHRGRGRPGR